MKQSAPKNVPSLNKRDRYLEKFSACLFNSSTVFGVVKITYSLRMPLCNLLCLREISERMGCYLNYDNMCRNVLILLNGNLIFRIFSFLIIQKPIFGILYLSTLAENTVARILFLCVDNS